jgi:N-acetylglucosamine kinase-like BadF-type ATPase
VLAVDGGNSKTDVTLVAADGRVLASVRGPTCSHQQVGVDAGMAELAALVDRAASEAGGSSAVRPVADLAVYGLAGADFPSDVRLLSRALAAQRFAPTDVVLNDTFIALRAGTRRPWGVALICGQGVNACAVAPDGRSARFDGVGDASGDWGGAGGLGSAAVAAAVRGRDGRGERTALERLVPAHFGLRSPGALTRALYFERLSERRLSELAPLVFEAAAAGDAVARSIVDRLADELVAMARALIRRLHLSRLDPEVVLAGGVFRTDEPGFYARLDAGILSAAPQAKLVRLAAPPVLGAALLGLDRLAGGTTDAAAEARLRGDLTRIQEHAD